MSDDSVSSGGSDDECHVGLSTSADIMERIHSLYLQDHGLVDVAKLAKVGLLPPSKKATVMLVGNHSSGKSSLINFIAGSDVLRTSVAIETQGVTFVTEGKRRDVLHGPATSKLFGRFRGMDQFPGLLAQVETQIVPPAAPGSTCSPSFPLLTLIDTPGLVDGNMAYPFDVNKVLEWFAARVDLIFVLFDPLGQALCDRTMALVSAIDARHPEKIRYLVSKMDTVTTESDRSRVLIQITQNLTSHISPKTALRLPSIHIPLPGETRDAPKFANSIWNVLDEVDAVIGATVQSTIKQLKADATLLTTRLSAIRQTDLDAINHNFSASVRGWIVTFVAIALAAAASLLVAVSVGVLPLLVVPLHPYTGVSPDSVADALAALAVHLPSGLALVYTVAALYAAALVAILFGRWMYSARAPVLPRARVFELLAALDFLTHECLPLPDMLYTQYFEDSVDRDTL